MLKLYSPDSETELALMTGILEAGNIPFFVFNDHFGTMRMGPKIDILNAKFIFVSEDQYEPAKDLLADFVEQTRNHAQEPESRYSTADKVRMILETLIFGWFIPGHKWRRNHLPE